MYNFPPSGTAADMMYKELVWVDNELPKEASIRLTVHDDITVCAHRSVAREAMLCLRENMQRTWPEIVQASDSPDTVRQYYPNGWFCPVEAHIGMNWREAKKGNAELEKEILQ